MQKRRVRVVTYSRRLPIKRAKKEGNADKTCKKIVSLYAATIKICKKEGTNTSLQIKNAKGLLIMSQFVCMRINIIPFSDVFTESVGNICKKS